MHYQELIDQIQDYDEGEKKVSTNKLSKILDYYISATHDKDFCHRFLLLNAAVVFDG